MAKHRANTTTLPEMRDLVNMHLAGREPALLATLIGIAIKLFSAFVIDLNIQQQSLLNAAVAALIGLIIAWSTRDGLSAGILGAAQALLALAIGFGLRLDPDNQALIMSFVATAIGMFERTQVTAPLPPDPPVTR